MTDDDRGLTELIQRAWYNAEEINEQRFGTGPNSRWVMANVAVGVVKSASDDVDTADELVATWQAALGDSHPFGLTDGQLRELAEAAVTGGPPDPASEPNVDLARDEALHRALSLCADDAEQIERTGSPPWSRFARTGEWLPGLGTALVALGNSGLISWPPAEDSEVVGGSQCAVLTDAGHAVLDRWDTELFGEPPESSWPDVAELDLNPDHAELEAYRSVLVALERSSAALSTVVAAHRRTVSAPLLRTARDAANDVNHALCALRKLSGEVAS